MAVTRTNCLAGPCIVMIDGTDIGLTTKDGVELVPEDSLVDLTGPQALGLVDQHREMHALGFKFTMQEISLANLKTMLDGSTAVSGGVLAHTVRGAVTRHAVEFIGPGPNGATRRFTATASLRIAGGIKVTNSEYQSAPVEGNCFIDTATGLHYTITDVAASGTAPTVASFQELAAADDSPTTITDPDTGFVVTSAIQATFSKAISPSSLGGGRFQILAADGAAIAATVSFGTTTGATDYTKVKVKPTSSLSGSTAYKLLIAAGVEALDGTQLAASSHIDFTTA